MRTKPTSDFFNQLKKLANPILARKVFRIIEIAENARSLRDIPNVKKLRGHTTAYRIRIGDYRIGILLDGDMVIFASIARRSIFYRFWP